MMHAIMPIIGIILIIIVQFLFFDWHAREVFIAFGYCRRYGHGKSFKRAHKHYKGNWTFAQRMLWMPVMKEWYETKYRAMAYLSYVHFLLTVTSLFWFLLSEFVFKEIAFWHYVFIVTVVFCLARFIYDDKVGRSNKRKM